MPSSHTPEKLKENLANWPKAWRAADADIEVGQKIVQAIQPFVLGLVNEKASATSRPERPDRDERGHAASPLDNQPRVLTWVERLGYNVTVTHCIELGLFYKRRVKSIVACYFRTGLLAVLYLFPFFCAIAAGPSVSNVRAIQRAGTKLVDINYDLSDAGSSSLTVSVAVSTNGGSSYTLPAASFIGDMGAGVAPGSNKRITWNAGADWNGSFSANVIYRVIADETLTSSPPSGMALIPDGSFTMGNSMNPSEGISRELPLHTVSVSAFYMDRYDVTKAMWDGVLQWAINNGYSFDSGAQGKGANHPAQSMSWYDAIKWCNARSEKEGVTPAYYTDAGLTVRYRSGQIAPYVNWSSGYRLPTEAEWEKAARGGKSGQRFPWGNTISWSDANYYAYPSGFAFDVNSTSGENPIFNFGSATYTSPVTYFPPNGYGLYDMAGNVWQWCWDRYGSYTSSPQTNPTGASSGAHRVVRGGGWANSAKFCRVSGCFDYAPDYKSDLIGFRSALSIQALSTSADSSATLVDTRDNPLTVIGRVRDQKTGMVLANVSISLAEQSTISAGDGFFTLQDVNTARGATLVASKTGYSTDTEFVDAPAGAKIFTLPDIFLEPGTNKPVICKISAKYEGVFLSAVSLMNEYTANVNWNGLAPGYIEFYVNNVLNQRVIVSGNQAAANIDMGSGFFGSLTLGANKIQVIAVSTNGVRSKVYEQTVRIIPPPPLIAEAGVVLAAFEFLPGNDPTFSFETKFPDDEIASGALQNIPFLGKFGCNFAVAGGFEYALKSGEWQAHIGMEPYGRWAGRRGRRAHSTIRRPKVYAGNRTIDFAADGRAEGVASQTLGIQLNTLGLDLSADYEQELLSFYLTDYVPGAQWARCLNGLKKCGVDPNSVQRVIVYGQLGAALSFNARINPRPIQYDNTTVGLTLGVRASYEPDLKVVKGEITVGGKVDSVFQLNPGLDFKSVSGSVYGEVSFTALLWKLLDEKFILLKYTYPQRALRSLSNARMLTLSSDADDAWVAIPIESETSSHIGRDYLKDGPEVFVAGDSGKSALLRQIVSPLADFRALSASPADGSLTSGSISIGQKTALGVSQISSPSQADLTMVQNCFPNSEPAIAANGTELMLLYVADNGSSNTLQCTDIKWTRWDGINWSQPLTLKTNTQAEFAPQVRYDGNGDAIAVWEQVAAPNFTTDDFAAMAAQMEIVWSRWDRRSGVWSAPTALTANNYLDHSPLLCGPLANGKLMLAWTENESNLLMGTNAPGIDTVLWCEWNGANQTWSAPKIMVSGLGYRLSQSMAATTNCAVYAWTSDLDGVLTNDTDQQVFYCVYTNGTWTAATQFTTNGVANKNVRVALSAKGDAYIVWQSGTNLVMDRNFSGVQRLVRPESQSAGFADYATTVGPMGNLILLWQEVSPNGSDAHYSVYDPTSDTWGRDDLLCQDPPLERSFAPVWDNLGNLTVAYNKVQMVYTNKTVTLDDGGTVTITNVPQFGRVDLVVTKRALVKDLALAAGDFSIDGVNYLPGDPLTLTAVVRNVGNIAMSNVVVGFYDGNPNSGGVLITNVNLPGWLEAAGTNTVSVVWIVPEPAAAHTIFALVNQNSLASEFNGTNNVQQVSIGGTDLAVSLVSYRAETNGAVRIFAQVQNLGAPVATNTILAIRYDGQTNAPLSIANVPVLEPGMLAQVALDLPPGTQPGGEVRYRLIADEERLIADVNPDNNSTAFAVNLWMDSDADGIPDSWMIEQFGHSTGLASDKSCAADDADGDGVSNLAECFAGTDPKNPNSYLRINSITVDGTSGSGIVWGSTSNKLYSIQRTSDLSSGFSSISEHILSTPPENTYFDSSTTNGASFFYRIKVE